MQNNPYANYKRMQVETASPGRLLLMLYEGALKNMRMAQECLAQKNMERAHNHLVKAQDIVMELNCTLNMDSGEIAEKLRSLYVYIHKRLIDANLKKDAAIVQEVINVMSTLKEAWDSIILKNNSAQTP